MLIMNSQTYPFKWNYTATFGTEKRIYKASNIKANYLKWPTFGQVCAISSKTLRSYSEKFFMPYFGNRVNGKSLQ